MSTPEPFGARLAAAMDEHGPLCVGIDPHPRLLARWGLDDSAHGVREFSLRLVDALAGRVAAIKPQAAFYERHGSAGVAALEDTIAATPGSGTMMIVDAKRGDIGSTMSAYADAFLRDGSPLAGDAVTVSPYLGFGSLDPAVELATATGRGLFVLCLTSNPQGPQVQHARTDTATGPKSVAAVIAAHAAALNAAALREATSHDAFGAHGTNGPADRMGSIGLVVGATIGDAADTTATDLKAVRGPLLAPGVGAQGAGPVELAAAFGDARGNVLASSSRDILSAGPKPTGLRDAAARTVDEIGRALRG